MQLKYVEPAAKEAFIEWYELGENNDITGNPIPPEEHPDIKAIVDYYNNAIAQGPAVEVING